MAWTAWGAGAGKGQLTLQKSEKRNLFSPDQFLRIHCDFSMVLFLLLMAALRGPSFFSPIGLLAEKSVNLFLPLAVHRLSF